jgi:hypothetical protein
VAQGTQRPHFVPRTYLKAWANAKDQVAYRRRDGDGALVTNITNVAVAGGIYGTGEVAQAREDFFKQLEDEWADLREQLTTDGDLHGERRSLLALFAAVQLKRTDKDHQANNFICDVADATNERPIPRDPVRQCLVRLAGAEPDDNEVEAAWSFVNGTPGGEIPTREMLFNVAMEVAVSTVAPRLEAKAWTVYKYKDPILLSSDCPVLKWRRPSAEPHYGGVGIGTADEIRFPLSPNALLVMAEETRDARRNPNSRKINAEAVKQCHKFVFGTPEAKAALDNYEISRRAPRVRFHTRPLYDSADMYVIRTYVE